MAFSLPKISKKHTIMLVAFAVFGVLVLGTIFFMNTDIAVLSPRGTVAEKERNLIVIATLLMLVVVLPVFAMTFGIAWKYRASNKKAQYSPDWDHSRLAETIWWTVPLAIIAILAVITWKTTHELDPYRPLESNKQPLTIQVIALEWKWLFIYPEQKIATINYVRFPEDRPVTFNITADAPMNSFWIPQLGGQIYAMAGMNTKLHLIADSTGTYDGSSANLSGEGFAGMKFVAESVSEADFAAWAKKTRTSPHILSSDTYRDLAKPSKNEPVTLYASDDQTLYDTVMKKYMEPSAEGREPRSYEKHH